MLNEVIEPVHILPLQQGDAGEADLIKIVQLWVTRDQGKSWKPSSEAGIKEEWGKAKAAADPHWTQIPGTITVREDGTYGFLLQVRNGQESPRPVASTAPAITVIVSTPPGSLFPEILQPREGEEMPADTPVLLRWSTPERGYRPDSVAIFASFAGEGERIVGKDLPLTGTHMWRTPARGEGRLRLRIVAFRESGLEMKCLEVRNLMLVASGSSKALFPEIVQPREGDELPADMPVLLRWSAPEKGHRPDSVAIFASFAGEGEQIVGKDLPLEGTREWKTPAREGGKLRLRIVAFKESGTETQGLEVRTVTLRGSPENPLRWLYPDGRVQWMGSETIELQWTALRGDFVPHSGALYYTIDDGPPFLITKGLEPAGFYYWTVPSQPTEKLRLRIEATTAGGESKSAASVFITVKSSIRANIEVARKNADRARILAAQGRTGFAIAAYEESLSYWAEYPEALNDVGAVYASERQYAKALECFLRARRASPSSAVPYVNAASMEIKLALLDDALADLKDAVYLGVDHDVRLAIQATVRLWDLSRAYADAGDRKRSDECCDLILRIRNAEKKIRARAQEQLENSKKP